jgi:hypothetical protein
MCASGCLGVCPHMSVTVRASPCVCAPTPPTVRTSSDTAATSAPPFATQPLDNLYSAVAPRSGPGARRAVTAPESTRSRRPDSQETCSESDPSRRALATLACGPNTAAASESRARRASDSAWPTTMAVSVDVAAVQQQRACPGGETSTGRPVTPPGPGRLDSDRWMFGCRCNRPHHAYRRLENGSGTGAREGGGNGPRNPLRAGPVHYCTCRTVHVQSAARRASGQQRLLVCAALVAQSRRQRQGTQGG